MIDRPDPGQRGFALLVVLWAMVLLAMVGVQVASSGRIEARLAGNVRAAAEAEAVADGAVYEALLHVMDGSEQRWRADGQPRDVNGPGRIVRVLIEDQRARIDLNAASAGVLQALMTHLDVAPERAARLAAAILDWRTAVPRPRPLGAKEPQYRSAQLGYAPPNTDFEQVGELRLVLGMTPDIVHRLAPFLTVYPAGGPDLAIADPVIVQAVHESGELAVDPGQPSETLAGYARVVLITVTASVADGAVATRRAEVQIGSGRHGRNYQILSWDRPIP